MNAHQECLTSALAHSSSSIILLTMLHSEPQLLRHEENFFVHPSIHSLGRLFLHFGADHEGSTWTCPVTSAGFYCSPFPRKLILVSRTQSLIVLDEGVNVAIFKNQAAPMFANGFSTSSAFQLIRRHIITLFFLLHFMLKHPLISGNLDREVLI